MYTGWHQLAFERELSSDITATSVGRVPLILVKTPNGFRTFDAVCPHRGAHLAFGGRLEGEAIVCPFHGRPIGLGQCSREDYRVREYRTLAVSGLIFVLMSERHENGFGDFMRGLDESHYFVPGFTLHTRALPEVVMENAFDSRHFKYVHGLKDEPELRLRPGAGGELAIEADFLTNNPNVWQAGREDGSMVNTRFFARVFSPGVCVTELGDESNPYVLVTAATPTSEGKCIIRVSVAAAAGPGGAAPSEQMIRALLRDSKISFEQDLVIWENLSTKSPIRFAKDDGLMITYHKFCRRFAEEK